jgi:hypothetical protein
LFLKKKKKRIKITEFKKKLFKKKKKQKKKIDPKIKIKKSFLPSSIKWTNKGGILDSNNVHSTYLNINTTLGAHFNSNTSHIIHIYLINSVTLHQLKICSFK